MNSQIMNIPRVSSNILMPLLPFITLQRSVLKIALRSSVTWSKISTIRLKFLLQTTKHFLVDCLVVVPKWDSVNASKQ